jgi:hypothetical protein
LQIDRAVSEPVLGFLDHDFGDAVGFGVREGGGFAIGAEDVECGFTFLLDIADELVDGGPKDCFFVGGEGDVVGGGEVREAGGAFGLFALAGRGVS